MLEVKALKKSYGKVVAVDGVNLGASAGETVGLLGPNGAGKTTTVSIIAGLLRPDSGEELIEGSRSRKMLIPAAVVITVALAASAAYFFTRSGRRAH